MLRPNCPGLKLQWVEGISGGGAVQLGRLYGGLAMVIVGDVVMSMATVNKRRGGGDWWWGLVSGCRGEAHDRVGRVRA